MSPDDSCGSLFTIGGGASSGMMWISTVEDVDEDIKIEIEMGIEQNARINFSVCSTMFVDSSCAVENVFFRLFFIYHFFTSPESLKSNSVFDLRHTENDGLRNADVWLPICEQQWKSTPIEYLYQTDQITTVIPEEGQVCCRRRCGARFGHTG